MIMHQPRAVRGIWAVVVLLSALLGPPLHATLPAEGSAPRPRVDFRGGLLSIDVQAGAWGAVLQEVQRQTGIRLHCHISLEGTLTASFTALPVERAVRHLFGPDANFIFVYPSPRVAPTSLLLPSEVWIVGRGPQQIATLHGFAVRSEVRASSTPGTPHEPGLEMASEFDRNPQAAQEMALDAPDPEVRLAAIAHLGQQAHPAAVSVLLEVVQDPDPHFRQSALEALLPLLDENPHVRTGLTQVLHTAQDPEVRQLAADALGIPLDAGADQGASGATPGVMSQ